MIIGITGKKQVGKDTMGKYIAKHYGFKVLSFAEPIRQIGKIFGFSKSQMTKHKEIKHPVIGVAWRTFAQIVGTDLFRNNFKENIWLILLSEKIKHFKDVVITDVRFDNEAVMIKHMGGYIIKIERETGLKDNHISEKGIKTCLIDATIKNDSSKSKYYAEIKYMMTNFEDYLQEHKPVCYCKNCTLKYKKIREYLL